MHTHKKSVFLANIVCRFADLSSLVQLLSRVNLHPSHPILQSLGWELLSTTWPPAPEGKEGRAWASRAGCSLSLANLPAPTHLTPSHFSVHELQCQRDIPAPGPVFAGERGRRFAQLSSLPKGAFKIAFESTCNQFPCTCSSFPNTNLPLPGILPLFK